MGRKYIWQHASWPDLQWDARALAELISRCRQKQHFLLGAVSVLGFDLRLQAQGVILEKEVLETSAIEGERLDPEGVRSSVARKLGLSVAGLRSADQKIDGTVEVLLDAAQHYNTVSGSRAGMLPFFQTDTPVFTVSLLEIGGSRTWNRKVDNWCIIRHLRRMLSRRK
ncbi:MAG: DUF4172 domain-containing protein [Candidatus Electrothrix sp. AR3]|nr:DUF4172 domain-containing protein [Candidatus Electrothrix sp. AR3]